MLKHKSRDDHEHVEEPTLVDRDEDREVEGDVGREPEPVLVERDDALPPPPHEEGVRVEQITTETVFSPGQVLILLAGAAALALGVATMVDAGLGGSLTEPVVEVFEWDHTPLLGLVEAVAGALLLLAGLVPSGRTAAGFVGALMIAGGVVVLAEVDWVQEKFAAEQSYGWVPIVIGGVALLAAFALPTRSSRRVTVVR